MKLRHGQLSGYGLGLSLAAVAVMAAETRPGSGQKSWGRQKKGRGSEVASCVDASGMG